MSGSSEESTASSPAIKKAKTDPDEASTSGSQEDKKAQNLFPAVINPDGFEIEGELIHEGPNAKSYRGKYFSEQVLVKIFPKAYFCDFVREASTLFKLKHENIVQLVAVGKLVDGGLFITKFLQGGTLKELLERCCQGREPALPLPRAIGYALDIARAMDYVHKKKFIHRDLKSGNVILTGNQDRAVLIDFGNSIKEDLSGMLGGAGTPFWSAPEMMSEDDSILHYDHKVDVFSFSIVLWELITCKTPYQEQPIPEDKILEGIKAHKIRPSMEGIQIPEKLDTLLKSCWAPEAADRPEFSEITTKLEEILRTLIPADTTAPVTAAKAQPGDDQGWDALGSDEKFESWYKTVLKDPDNPSPFI